METDEQRWNSETIATDWVDETEIGDAVGRREYGIVSVYGGRMDASV